MSTPTDTPTPPQPLPYSSATAPPQAAGPVTPVPANLGQRTAKGLLWLLLQTGGVKVVTLVQQLSLAALLAKDDFGKLGLAWTVLGFSGLIQQAGLGDVLVQRQAEYDRWVNPCFWMGIVCAIASGLLMTLLAFPASWFYGSAQLAYVLLIFALYVPINSLSIIPIAILRIRLNFRMIAAVGFGEVVVIAVLSITMAWLGFGAYSFVAPLPISATLKAIFLWTVARPPLRRSLEIPAWRGLFGDSGWRMGIDFTSFLSTRGDSIILGRLASDAVVGVYFFGYQLANQTAQVVSSNLSSALYPALSKMVGQTQAQCDAFMRASRLLTLAAVPGFFMQAIVAGPALRLVYKDKWVHAEPVIMLLSVGMTLFALSGSTSSLMQAQGRFRGLFRFWIVASLLFLAMVAVGAWLGQRLFADATGQAIAVAAAAAAWATLIGPAGAYVAVRQAGLGLSDVLKVYAAPVFSGVIAFGGIYALAQLPILGQINATAADLIRLVAGLTLAPLLYLVLIRLTAPAESKELYGRLRRALKRGS